MPADESSGAARTANSAGSRPVVAVLGATAGQGRGIAYRLTRTGTPVLIGSRDERRAAVAAREIAGGAPEPRGGINAEVAAQADVVVLAVPWVAHSEVIETLAPVLAGKIVVDCCNPLSFDAAGAHPVRVDEGSAAEQAAALLPDSRVVAAFHHVSSSLLLDAALTPLPSLDILVAGDDRDACRVVEQLISAVPGLRGVYSGSLRHARQLESLSATLISLRHEHRAYTGVTFHGIMDTT